VGVNKLAKWLRCLLKVQRMAFARVREVQPADRHEVAKMRALLWPEASVEEHLLELEHLLGHGMNGTLPVVIFVSCEEDGTLTGFLEVGLRSHADGCNLYTRSGSWKAGLFMNRFGIAALANC
jgi:hypothetical protein